MLKTVWKACEEELKRLHEGWKDAVDTCYPVSGPRHILKPRNESDDALWFAGREGIGIQSR